MGKHRAHTAIAAVSLIAAVLLLAAPSAAANDFGPLPPPNPAAGPVGTATQHGDTEASDTTPYAGPGRGPVDAKLNVLGMNCASILIGPDGMVQALCAKPPNLAPVVQLLDPATGASLASSTLPLGGTFSGVYGYLDNAGRMVAIDGDRNLVRVGHDRGGENGAWRLFVAESTPIGDAVDANCGASRCDTVIAPTPDYSGKVWFATQRGTIGLTDTAAGTTRTVALGPGEVVANSISTSPEGMSVATTHALYMLAANLDGTPRILWRKDYDRGPGRKPGQLSWGTGATPTFFGPRTGDEYLAIVDNAAPLENLLVYKAGTGDLVCSVPAIDGTENSPIGSGNTVVVTSTYGYPYPIDLGPSVPPTAEFAGGMTRIDVDAAGTGCEKKWTADVRSASVPKLSVTDGNIYTVAQAPPGAQVGANRYEYTVVDALTGQIKTGQPVGEGVPANPNQLAGNISRDHILYQGTVTGVYRIAPTRNPGTGSSGSSIGPIFGSGS